MNRRSFLYLAGGAGLGGGGVMFASGDVAVPSGVQFDRPESNSTNDGGDRTPTATPESLLRQEFSAGLLGDTHGFESIEFSKEEGEWVATISLNGTGVDGFGIHHATLEPYDGDFYTCDAPTALGERTIPIETGLIRQDATYPNREFALSAYDGTFLSCDYGMGMQAAENFDVHGSVEFTLPEQIAPGVFVE